MTDIVARIDEALGCQRCGKKLRENGPSLDFCGESCAMAWRAKQAARPALGLTMEDRAMLLHGYPISGPDPRRAWLVAAIDQEMPRVVERINGRVDEIAAAVQMDNTEAVYTPAEPANESGWLPRWFRRLR